ncbi:uncharacterized protein LOC118183151, partial [Stegodyphus dumicola]|uniref:uncharacterized protein LOC118183151 n=1 Tax=Stegodyphus dumicola TaxID=202533 RepID=UPI0015AEE070
MSQPAETKSGFYGPDVQDNTDEELQKFLIYFLDEKEPHVKAEKLLIFARSYLPASSQQASCKTRSDFFCNLITQIPAILNMLGISNIGNAETLKEIELHNDKNILNLQRAGLCLETLCLCLENSHTSQELHCALKITLTALLQAYYHCKESEQIYGNLLEDFAHHLGYFFKKIEDLQTAMLLILDDSNKMAYSDEDIHSVCSIAHNIEKLCILVSNLDQLMSTKLWKIFIKYVSFM